MNFPTRLTSARLTICALLTISGVGAAAGGVRPSQDPVTQEREKFHQKCEKMRALSLKILDQRMKEKNVQLDKIQIVGPRIDRSTGDTVFLANPSAGDGTHIFATYKKQDFLLTIWPDTLETGIGLKGAVQEKFIQDAGIQVYSMIKQEGAASRPGPQTDAAYDLEKKLWPKSMSGQSKRNALVLPPRMP